ncbi:MULTISPECIES: hypothetical protein [Bacteroides]|uniref:GumC family protein n=1 Tax=Bacteroides TaxID=816 RepID=UPI002A81D22C|nr:hypothetical protein [Bacteroides nordii]
MDYILYIFRALYRKRWWIILGTALFTTIVIHKTKGMRGSYNVEATLYTGVVSGYGIEENNTGVNWAIAQNAIDNLINIIQSESTLKRVSMRLFARILVKGDPNKDQNEITSASYNYTYDHMKNSLHGKELIALIDKNSEDKTMENFLKYEKPDKNNYIYGLFYYQHPYYSYGALKRIQVGRLGNSDLLKINYSSGDPGITYNTIEILMKEFVNEYRILRYGETDKVIEYFRSELNRIGNELTNHEDDLTKYNVDNRIINYYDETKEIAAINKEFELREQDIRFSYNSSKAMLEELEKQMDNNTRQAITNLNLVDKLKLASDLTGKITEMETISKKEATSDEQLTEYKNKLTETRKELSNISNQYIGDKYSKSGLARNNIVEQWLDQTLLYEKAKAELEIAQKSRIDLNDKYQFFAPVGTTLKRKERVINFSEQSYLTNLKSYNDALMRKKNLEMTSAALKVLNPPAYPISTESTNRRKIIYMAFLGSFLFLTGFFLLIEFIDRTLRDSVRTRKLTGCPVLSDFPNNTRLTPYSKTYENISTRNLSNGVFRFFTQKEDGKPYILNLLSVREKDGKSYIGEHLEEYWISIGLKVRRLSPEVDYVPNSSRYMLASNVSELYTPDNEDILIVEYPELSQYNIPTPLLRNAQLNLMIVSADYGWKSTDRILLHKLESQIGDKPYICLNRAPRYDMENFTGMLPPYTPLRKLLYRLSQLALTESFIHWRSYLKKKQKTRPVIASTDNDDDDE